MVCTQFFSRECIICMAITNCFYLIDVTDIKVLCGDPDLVLKYEEFMLRRVMAMEPDARWCPAPDCGWVFEESAFSGVSQDSVKHWF